ncbi:hypothetical protein ACFX58_03575 [Sphingomonas sp. NCPPB 2930]
MSLHKSRAWFVGAALIALGMHRANDMATQFTQYDLAQWIPAYRGPDTAIMAIKALLNSKLIEGEPCGLGHVTRRSRSYRLTTEGVAAARSALHSDKTLHPAAYGSAAKPAGPVDPFAQRLWSLLRIRRALTADDAASTLVDAGDDVARARRKAGELLLAWSRICPPPVQVSAKRVDGFKRYVLVVDLGLLPPAISARSRA